jgi:membrane-associated phospholipid phosphatase
MINPVVAVIACAYAFLMGCSRVYLKTHYVTDVIAGGLIGLICAEAVKWFFK